MPYARIACSVSCLSGLLYGGALWGFMAVCLRSCYAHRRKTRCEPLKVLWAYSYATRGAKSLCGLFFVGEIRALGVLD